MKEDFAVCQAGIHQSFKEEKMSNEEVMRERVERMNRKLHEAAVEGSVTSLSQLLQEDKLVLDRFVVGCFPETPLHIAAMLGHVEFVKMILALKPELASESDFQRSSPLHLATAKGHVEIVKLLLKADPEMCSARDLEGRNPLHVAVMKGRFDVLKELVRAKPEAARAWVERSGTILHLCVKHNQLEALKLLVEVIDDNEFVNSKDDDGFTILHLAVAEKQIEVIRFLITVAKLEVNALNANGFTALDILTHSRRDVKDIEIRESLQGVGALRANDSPLDAHEHVAIRPMNLSSGPSSSDPKREQKWYGLMLVASLITVMAFQAGIQPPHFNGDEDKMGSFIIYNSVAFTASLSVILLLISGLPLKKSVFKWILMIIMWVAILSVSYAYMYALDLTEPTYEFGVTSIMIFVIFVWKAVVVLCLAILLVVKLVKYFKSKLKARRQRRSDSMV